MKQVAHIRQISFAFRQRFGTPTTVCGARVVFPDAGRVAGLTEAALRACALGYRAKNLLATAQRVASGEADLESWRALPDDELRAQLCALPGVGPKVANCVMLFAYERFRAFPIDVWIERVLMQKYFPRQRRVTARQLREFRRSISASTEVMRSSIFSTTRARQPRAGCHPTQGEIILLLKKLAHRPPTRFRVVV